MGASPEFPLQQHSGIAWDSAVKHPSHQGSPPYGRIGSAGGQFVHAAAVTAASSDC